MCATRLHQCLLLRPACFFTLLFCRGHVTAHHSAISSGTKGAFFDDTRHGTASTASQLRWSGPAGDSLQSDPLHPSYWHPCRQEGFGVLLVAQDSHKVFGGPRCALHLLHIRLHVAVIMMTFTLSPPSPHLEAADLMFMCRTSTCPGEQPSQHAVAAYAPADMPDQELDRKCMQAAIDLQEHGWAVVEGVLPE